MTHVIPVFLTSSTAANISCLMSGFSCAICSPRSMKFSVAFSTAATNTCALFERPFFFFDGPFVFTSVVTFQTIECSTFVTMLARLMIKYFLPYLHHQWLKREFNCTSTNLQVLWVPFENYLSRWFRF